MERAWQPPTIKALCEAVWAGSLETVDALLAGGAPAAPATIDQGVSDYIRLPSSHKEGSHCSIQPSAHRAAAPRHQGAAGPGAGGPLAARQQLLPAPPAADRLPCRALLQGAGDKGREWDARLVPVMDRLHAAGYRPAAFADVRVRTVAGGAAWWERQSPLSPAWTPLPKTRGSSWRA